MNKIQLNGDGIGYVEQYDFSRGNLSEESRINTVTNVASICVGNLEAKNKIKLYDRLATESVGIPSSSYEFVPVLLTMLDILKIEEICYSSGKSTTHIEKYGEWVEGGKYLLTNLRALINDVGEKSKYFYNTKEECSIIKKHFKVFKCKIDLATARQLMRHRASFQELSRRYTTNKKHPFEFYISDKLKELPEVETSFKNAVLLYNMLLVKGVKAQEARRVLPQAMYTTVYTAWLPSQLKNMLTLRTASGAQKEVRELAMAIEYLTK